MTTQTPAQTTSGYIPANAPAPALENTEKPQQTQKEPGAATVAVLLAQKRIPEIFGLLGLIFDRAMQERLLARLPLLPWYPPEPSAGGIWREE